MPHDDLPSDYGRRIETRPIPLIRTPEAIREDIDNHRARHGIKRPITVTVIGDRGSGKTTLIAVVAQALENSGHLVSKPEHVPNATRAVMDLHEQFDVTFVERDMTLDQEVARENANLRASIDELRGMVAGLKGENGRLRGSNSLLVGTDEKLRAEIAALKQALSEAMSVVPITRAKVREQIDMAFEEVRQAAYVEMERNRLRTAAEDLRHQARKLGHEGDARLQKARERMLFALTGGHAFQAEIVEHHEDHEDFPADVCRPRTLMEQAQDVYQGTREAAATDKLLAANIALMGDEDYSEGC